MTALPGINHEKLAYTRHITISTLFFAHIHLQYRVYRRFSSRFQEQERGGLSVRPARRSPMK
ncbi:hypothetical protein LCGC14_1654480 [marine sediment metagenome]|uniref:Uncharacterized protein n=1 Tax=marine sediment metagenome TaxID=412755 RepID=A0A0F9HVW5_9ZZZZ